MSKFKIISWNINSVRTRLSLLKILIDKENPDVILLQETKVIDAFFPSEIISEMGYDSAFLGEKSYNGVAILSKHLIEDISYLKDQPKFNEKLETRYIDALIKGIRVASVYVPNGREIDDPHYFYKEKFYESLQNNIKNHLDKGEKIICAGDYNVAPTDRDTWNEKIWRGRVSCSDRERKWFENFCSIGMNDIMDIGWHDKSEKILPHLPKNNFTWWDYRHQAAQKNYGLRIDQIIISNNLIENKFDSKVCEYIRKDKDIIGENKTSDHAPICCEIHL